jgi:hypothetical protein
MGADTGGQTGSFGGAYFETLRGVTPIPLYVLYIYNE